MKNNPPRILVVDDEIEICRFFEEFLASEKGCSVTTAVSGRVARKKFQSESFDLAFLDLKLPDATGIDLLQELKEVQPACKVVIMTGHGTTRTAVSAIRLGALDYVEKPFDELDELDAILVRALGGDEAGSQGRSRADAPENFNMVCAPDSPLREVVDVAGKIARKNLTVLISGPTGAGKEVLARYIHANSHRSENPFITVNCGAFSETLLETELFGHEKGAFTGAAGARKGIFEIADGGTLFLDEIGEATPAIQVKLLRVLELGEYMRVGGEVSRRSDVRIIAATNVDLKASVERGAFRRDLFYRLDVVNLEVPPLRKRPEDLTLLLDHFIEKFLPPEERFPVVFTPRALKALLAYDWPGNVREMANVVARAMALREGSRMDVDLLAPKIAEGGRTPRERVSGDVTSQTVDAAIENLGKYLFEDVMAGGKRGDFDGLLDAAREWEGRIIAEALGRALKKSGGKRSAAAKMLGANPRALRYYLNERRK